MLRFGFGFHNKTNGFSVILVICLPRSWAPFLNLRQSLYVHEVRHPYDTTQLDFITRNLSKVIDAPNEPCIIIKYVPDVLYKDQQVVILLDQYHCRVQNRLFLLAGGASAHEDTVAVETHVLISQILGLITPKINRRPWGREWTDVLILFGCWRVDVHQLVWRKTWEHDLDHRLEVSKGKFMTKLHFPVHLFLHSRGY